MRLLIAKEGWPFVLGALGLFGAAAGVAALLGAPRAAAVLAVLAVAGAGVMLFFFRDPERVPPPGEGLILSGADGLIRSVEVVDEPWFIGGRALRISVFLGLQNVHINRSPLAGTVRSLDYTPGSHLLTLINRASLVNEHSSIGIEGAWTRCLVRQIVGPVVRRVIAWLKTGQTVAAGERIGLMKFGSRLDVYLPEGDAEPAVKPGDRVRAGETILARRVVRGETS